MATLFNIPTQYVIVGILLLAAVLFVLAFQQRWRARGSGTWRMRRNAGSRSGWFFLLSIVLFAVGGLLIVLTGSITQQVAVSVTAASTLPLTATSSTTPATPDLGGTVNALLTATAIQQQKTQVAVARRTATPTLTLTLVPTMTTTPSPTASATPTASPTITFTPSPTFDLVLNLTPPASPLNPREDAAIGITAASAAVSDDQQPVEPSKTFAAGIRRVYVFFGYLNMDNGLTWTRILYREGVPVQGGTYTWRLGDQGQSYFFFGRADGYAPGSYEVRIFVGVAEVSRFDFTISP